jgi:hypothetical protein
LAARDPQGSSGNAALISSSDSEKNAALRVLRFLDTPATVHELILLLGTPGVGDGWNEVAGLARSLHQSLVVRELEQQMAAPDIAVSGNYLFILAKLKLQLNHEPLPPYPEKNPEQQKHWTEQNAGAIQRTPGHTRRSL